MQQRPRISVVIPVKNEAATIGPLITRVREGLSGYDYEIVVVDDGSTDATIQVATTSVAKIVSHKVNYGKGAAMKTGVENTSGGIIVFVDGDGAHDPHEIPGLVSPIILGRADMVIGARQGKAAYPARRRIANSLASFGIAFTISVLLPLASRFKRPLKWTKVSDCTCGFRAIRRQEWARLRLTSDRFEVEAEMIYQAARNRVHFIEAPVKRSMGKGASDLSIRLDGFRTFKLLMRKLASDAFSKKW